MRFNVLKQSLGSIDNKRNHMDVQVLDNKTVCMMRGSIDTLTSNCLFNELGEVKETAEFYFDFSEVDFINAHFVTELIKSKEKFKNSKFFIINSAPRILELLKIMQVKQFASIVKHNTSDFMSVSN